MLSLFSLLYIYFISHVPVHHFYSHYLLLFTSLPLRFEIHIFYTFFPPLTSGTQSPNAFTDHGTMF